MMNGSPVCYSRTAIRRRRGGERKKEVIEQRVRMCQEAWSMYCTCMMGGAMRFPRGYLASGCTEACVKGGSTDVLI
jgi:hypothetical protein